MDTFQIVAINASTLGSSIRHGNFLYPCILIYFHWTGSHTVGISHIQAEYDNCTRDPGEVLNSSSPGVIVPLETSGSFYFYCTVDDHCGSGQKFAINALTNGSEPPSPSSASSFTIGAFVAAVVSTIVITVLIYD